MKSGPLTWIGVTALLLAACSADGVTTTEPLSAVATLATDLPEGEALIPEGCRLFDGEALGALTPIDRPLTINQETSTDTGLTCQFVGVGDGLDSGVRIAVESLDQYPPEHFITPGQFESALQVAGRQGVGTGRGDLRLQLDDERGLTLNVTIRTISSAGVTPSNGEFLSIRDQIAEYLITHLG